MLLQITSILLTLSCATTCNAAPNPRTLHRSYDMPLTRDPNYGFLGNISIGSPPQRITSFIDWTWTSQYVLSTTCDGNTTDTRSCLSPSQAIYNQSLSSTYVNKSKTYPSDSWYPNEFFPAPFNVDYASDIETIGPVSRRVVIQTSNFEPVIFQSVVFPFAGIFGLMPSLPGSDASTQAPFYQQYLAGAWPLPYTAFTLCPAFSCPPGASAIQTFGGFNHILASKGLTWYNVVPVPLVNELDFIFSPEIFSYWAISITGLSIGNQRQVLNSTMDGGPAAIFDHASKGRGVPLSANAYANLVLVTNATLLPPNSPALADPPNNGGGQFYSVDCHKVRDLPSIKYTFKGSSKQWKVSGDAYTVNKEGICVLNVRTIGLSDFQYGNFGEVFLKGKYVVFDFEKREVGLAQL